jgi:hypothetical protein
MPQQLAITARNLGRFNLPSYCPACLKYLLHLRFQPPYGMSGGLFGDAESCQKAILGYYLDKDGCLPKAFEPFCDVVARTKCNTHHSKFRAMHDSGVLLSGQPDEVLTLEDGSQCIIDHKSSRKDPNEDKFQGQYEVQVIGYAFIAEALGLGKVTKGGDIYWSAQVEAVEDDPSNHFDHSTLWVPFKPKPVEISIDYTILDPLIEEMKTLWNAKQTPDSRQGCDDCKKRDLLFAIEREFNLQDQAELDHYTSIGWQSKRREIRDSISRREDRQRKLLAEFNAVGNAIFSPDGMVANWEFLPSEGPADSKIA